MVEFEKWLNGKLVELRTDESVFGPYIHGILEGEETEEEQIEALEELLASAIIDGAAISGLIKEIFAKWGEKNSSSSSGSCQKNGKNLQEVENVDEKLARLLESNIVTNSVQRQHTAEERILRSKILAEYSQLSDPEADEEDNVAAGGASDPDLVRNTNVHDVQQLMKEKREQARMESQMKKEKDKEDREKQKKQREEKKEKRKTVKQERKR